MPLTGVVLWIALVLAIALIVSGLHDLVRDRAAVLTRFGERFVREFDRPLVRGRSFEPVVEARLRVRPCRSEVQVMLAPGDGRLYPNLVDHKRNVEYDVKRVMRSLGTHVVVSSRLRASGKWVVVPIRLADQAQTGAT